MKLYIYFIISTCILVLILKIIIYKKNYRNLIIFDVILELIRISIMLSIITFIFQGNMKSIYLILFTFIFLLREHIKEFYNCHIKQML